VGGWLRFRLPAVCGWGVVVLTSAKRVVNGRFGQSVAINDSHLLIGADSVGDGAAYVFGQSTG